MMLELWYDSIRVACWIAGALAVMIAVMNRHHADPKVRLFRFAWGLVGFAPVIGLLPSFALEGYAYPQWPILAWLAGLTCYYLALTMAAIAQSARPAASLGGSAMLLAFSVLVGIVL